MDQRTTETENELKKQKDELLYTCRGTGITLIVFGSLTFLFCISTLIMAAHRCCMSVTFVAGGIWCSAFTITAGALGISVSKCMTCVMLMWTMIFSILGSVLMFILLCLELAAIFQSFGDYAGYEVSSVHGVMLLFALVQFVISIYNSIVYSRLYTNHPQRSMVVDSCACCMPYGGAQQNMYQQSAMVPLSFPTNNANA